MTHYWRFTCMHSRTDILRNSIKFKKIPRCYQYYHEPDTARANNMCYKIMTRPSKSTHLWYVQERDA